MPAPALIRLEETSYTSDFWTSSAPDDYMARPRLVEKDNGDWMALGVKGTDHASSAGHSTHVRFSTDEGSTWTAEDTYTDSGSVTGLPSTGHSADDPTSDVLDSIPVKDPDGDLWILTSEGIRNGSNRYGTYAYKSTDGGKTWTDQGKIAFSADPDNNCKVWDWEVVSGVMYFTVTVDPSADLTAPLHTALYKVTNSAGYNLASMTHVSDITSTADDTHECGLAYLADADELLAVLRNTGDVGVRTRISNTTTELGDGWGTLTDSTDQLGTHTTPFCYRDSANRVWVMGRDGAPNKERNAIRHTIDGTTFSQPYFPGGGDIFYDDCGYTAIVEKTDGSFYGLCYTGTDEAADIDEFEFEIETGTPFFGVKQVRAITTGSTQKIALPGFGTPTGATVIATTADAMETQKPHGAISIGYADFTNSAVISTIAEDTVNPSTSRCHRDSDSAAVLQILNVNGFEEAKATITSTTDGITLTFSNLPTDTLIITVYLWGSGCTPTAGNVALGTQDTAVPVSVTGTPDLVFASCNGAGMNSALVHALMSFGFSDGTNQRGITFASQNSIATSDCASMHLTDSVGGQVTWSAVTWKASLDNFSSGNFDATAIGGNSGSDAIAYLAVQLPASVTVHIGSQDLPITASDLNVNGFGFTRRPGAFIQISSLVQTDSVHTPGDAAIWLSATDGVGEASIGFTDRDGRTLTDSLSTAADYFIDWDTPAGSNLYQAHVNNLTSAGGGQSQVDFSGTSGVVRKSFFLAMEAQDKSDQELAGLLTQQSQLLPTRSKLTSASYQ